MKEKPKQLKIDMSKYKDMLDLQRPEPIRERMSSVDRAAQFAPFAALTGFDDEIQEAAEKINEDEIRYLAERENKL